MNTTYYACIHGEPGSQTLGAKRTAPLVSELAFKFQAPAFASDVQLKVYFNETCFPLRVVFDDERGEEHLSQDGFTNYAEARRFMGAIAGLPVVDAYDARLRRSRKVQVRRVRLLTKDGRTLCKRQPGPAAG